jgi:putative SOS response-associated peptidase YedK
LASIHDRMPLILAPERYRAWLDPMNQDGAAVRELMQPAAVTLEFQPVSKRVNSPANDDAGLIDPVG